MKNARISVAVGLALLLSGCAHNSTPINPTYSNSALDAVSLAPPITFPLGSGDHLGQQLFSDSVSSAAVPMSIQTAGADDLQY